MSASDRAVRSRHSEGIANAEGRRDRAVLVVDHCSRLKYANPSGEALIADNVLTCEDGVIRTASVKSTERLHDAVRVAAGNGGTASRPLKLEDEAASFEISVLPLRPGDAGTFDGESLALLLAEKRRTENFDASLLRELYQLTRTEGELLAHLLSGATLAQYSAAREVKLTTAKTHLSSIFSKLGERRQSDVIRRVLNDLGRLAAT